MKDHTADRYRDLDTDWYLWMSQPSITWMPMNWIEQMHWETYVVLPHNTYRPHP